MYKDRGQQVSGQRREIAANDNAPARGQRSADAPGRIVGEGAAAPLLPANENDRRAPANDNDILVSDDLPRPLPIAVGEAELVRKLLGERFRQILKREWSDE